MTTHTAALIAQRLAAGLCTRCGKRPSHDARWCEQCREEERRRVQRAGSRYDAKPVARYRPGIRCCLSCEQRFRSWDVRANRICSKCRRFMQTYGAGIDDTMMFCV